MRGKYKKYTFPLNECKSNITIVPSDKKGKGFATAFLNIHLPDGRWIVFQISDDCRVPLYEKYDVGEL